MSILIFLAQKLQWIIKKLLVQTYILPRCWASKFLHWKCHIWTINDLGTFLAYIEEYVYRLPKYFLQKMNYKCWSYKTFDILSLNTMKYLLHKLSHLGFRDWINNLPTYCLCRQEIDFFILAIHLYPLLSSVFKSSYLLSIFTLYVAVFSNMNDYANKSNLILFYQVYKTSNITEYLRVTWNLIVW